MSTRKVLLTYKRKRHSSCSGAGNADVCPDSSDVRASKHQASPKESAKKDPMYHCQENEISDSSRRQLHDCIGIKEKFEAQRSDACNSGEMQQKSIKSSQDNVCKESGKNISNEATSHETTKSSCLDVDSSCSLVDGSIQASLLLQSEKEPISISKQKSMSTIDASKCQLTAPLLTFSRKLKIKGNVGSGALLGELFAKERAVAILGSEAVGVPSSSCEVTLNKMQAVEESSTLNMESENGNMSCQSGEKMISNESKDSPCLCTRSSGDLPALGQTEEKKCSHDDLVVDTSSVTKQSASAFSCSDAPETTNLLKDVVLRSSDDELVSCCDNVCKTDEQHVSTGDSLLTSSDCSDVKIFAEKAIQYTPLSASLDPPCPQSGSFVINCNANTESDRKEKESDTVQHSPAVIENRGKATEVGFQEKKCLELFPDTHLQAVDSPASVAAGKKPETTCLQLFSEVGQNGHSAPGKTPLETGYRRAQQSAAFSLECDTGHFAPPSRGIVGHTSREGSSMQLFPDQNAPIKEFIQNPGVQPFADPSFMLGQKVLLDNCNTRDTGLRGNQNISVHRFEPTPTIWSEEELDSLWIGIRRHGRGNWHAMLLDPKLRFAPWRVASDLAAQWNREQSSLLTRQYMPQGTCPNPSERASREKLSAETHLSLGDVYARREGNYFQSNGPNQSQMNVTLASKSGNYSNAVNASLEGMGLTSNSLLPHWLRGPTGSTLRVSDPSPWVSTMPQTGGLQLVPPSSAPSKTPMNFRSLWEKNRKNYKWSGSMASGSEQKPPGSLQNGVSGPSTRKPSGAEDVIIIDSDASSEETVSDDHHT